MSDTQRRTQKRKNPSDGNNEEELVRQFAEALFPLVEAFGWERMETVGRLFQGLRQRDETSARRLMERSPAILEGLMPYGGETVLQIFEWSRRLLPFGVMFPLHFLEASPKLLEKTDLETLSGIVDLLEETGRSFPNLLPALTETVAELVDLGGVALFREVTLYGTALAENSPAYALKAVMQSPSLSAELATLKDVDLAREVYRIGRRMTRTDWQGALQWLESIVPLARAYRQQGRLDLLSQLFREEKETASFHAELFLALIQKLPELIDSWGEAVARSIRDLLRKAANGHPENGVALWNEVSLLFPLRPENASKQWISTVLEGGQQLSRRYPALTLPFFHSLVPSPDLRTTEEVEAIYDTALELAQSSPPLAEAFLRNLPALRRQADLQAIREWIFRILPLARDSWETAAKLTAVGVDIIPFLDGEGWSQLLELLTLLSRESVAVTHQLLDRFPALIKEWQELGGRPIWDRICLLGKRTAPQNARLCLTLMLNSPEWLRVAGWKGLERITDTAAELGKTSWTAAVALMESGPRFLLRLSLEELERLSRSASRISRENPYAAVSLLAKGPDLLDRLQTIGGPSRGKAVFFLLCEKAQGNARLISGFLEKGPLLFSLLGPSAFEKWTGLLHRISGKSGPVAVSFLRLTPALHQRMGDKGLETAADLVLSLTASDGMTALSVLEKVPALLEDLEGKGGESAATAVFAASAAVAKTSRAAAAKLLEKSPHLLEWAGLEGFGRIAAFIEETAAEDEGKALSHLAADSPSWVDFLEDVPKGLELKTVKTTLSHYLKALLGRRVEIVEADEAYGDGRKIFLPRRVREFQEEEDNFLFYKVAATHEEAHLEYGSYEFDLARLGPQTKELLPPGKGPEALPDGGGSDLERFFLLFPEPSLARDLFHLLEDRRIDRRLGLVYPVLGEAIKRMNRHRTAKRRPPQKITPIKERVMEMIGWLIKADRLFSDADRRSDIILRRMQEKLPLLDSSLADVHTSAELTVSFYGLIASLSPEPYRPVKPLSRSLDQNKVFQHIGSFDKTSRKIQERIVGRGSEGKRPRRPQPETESGPGGNTQPSATLPDREDIRQRPVPEKKGERTFRGPIGGGRLEAEKDDRQRDETSASGEAMPFASPERIERLLKNLFREKGVTPKEIERRLESMNQNELFLFLNRLEASFSGKSELEPEKGTFLYPEWGEDIQDYRLNWIRIRERTASEGTLSFYRRTLDRHAPLLKKIRREFQLLRPEGFQRRQGQYDGDDIDLEAVVDFWADRKAGLSPEEKLYRLRRRRERDIAAAFLIDLSRSTQGEVIEREKEALIIMSEALEEVGDVFAVYGFSGDNRDHVDFYRIKDFEEPYGEKVKKRISALSDRFENRDGAAIRHTTERLKARPEKTRLLILLSDGKPVDKEYAGSYAIEDTRLALKEAERSGIKTFCLTVDRQAADYIPRMYSHSRWTVLDRVEKLPERIPRIYRTLTT